MAQLFVLRESAAEAAPLPIWETFTPLSESTLRPDGTIGIKIIGPGWGSSGYYGRDVLERDIPRIFPAGTQMFWNHDTATEEMERPEGDLSRLAAVTVSNPIWLEDGPKGPGMYADARPFKPYAETLNEIGQHIGVSIRALGRHTSGEAEGRSGRIIQELVAGKSIDYVTVPGAGGGIVGVFESAGERGQYPEPLRAFLQEAGRVLSAKNEKRLRAALAELNAVLSVFETEEAGGEPPNNTTTEVDMSEQELQEAQAELAQLRETLASRDDALAALREQLVLREARDFVSGRLAEAELPDMTRARLARSLAANPPVTDNGRVDEEALGRRVETAVTEAQAEIAAITGGDGRVRGNGTPQEPPAVDVAEARKRLETSLAAMGYGGNE